MTRLLFLALVSGAISVPAYGQAPPGPCKAVFDAVLKQMMTPHHAVTTSNGTALGEAIATKEAMYVKVNGAWKKSPMSPKDMLAQQQENIANTTVASCKALGDEPVDGTLATIYQTHYEQTGLGASDAKVWLSKATGLPLRTDVSLQGGEKVSVVTDFDYDHITAPVVK